jgi:hypothetical protein
MGESMEVKCPHGHQLVKLFTPPFQDIALWWCPVCMPEEEQKKLSRELVGIFNALKNKT